MTPPAGDGANSVEEAIGGYEREDAGKTFSQESPEHFLRQGVRLKRRAYEEADAAFDVEMVLDFAAALQAINNLYNTFDELVPATIQFAQDFNSVSENPLLPIVEAMPTMPQTGLAALSVGLLILAKKTWEATQKEKEFAYEEYVTARAIEAVAIEDNGIDAEELLSRFIMSFDIRPDMSKENWHHRIDYYRPSVKILPIKPEYAEAVEQKKREIIEQDRENGIVSSDLKKPKQMAQKIGKNLAKGAVLATRSLDPHLLSASKRILKGQASEQLFNWPEGGIVSYGRRLKRGIREDFAAARDTIRDSDLAKTLRTTGKSFKISWQLMRHRKKFDVVRNGRTWEEQTMDRRNFAANVAVTSHLDDIEAGQLHRDEITTPNLSESYAPAYFDKRKIQGERVRDIRGNVAQQFETAKGFVYANSFMAINAAFGALAFYSATGQNDAMTATATLGLVANGILSYANTFMNIPPMLSIGHGLVRQNTRYKDHAEKVLSVQSSVRKELRGIRALMVQPPAEVDPANDIETNGTAGKPELTN